MTVIVGILCKDGVVVASDSAATFGTGGNPTIGQQVVRKVRKLNDAVLLSSTGAVGLSQVIANMIATKWDERAFASQTKPAAVMDIVGKSIADLVAPYLQTGSMQRNLTGDASASLCKTLVAMPVDKKPCLFTFDFNGAPEQSTTDLPFVALGSGQPIADPFLAFLKRIMWVTDEPRVSEGRLAAVWTIEHVRRTNPGGVGGAIQLATLEARADKMPIVTVATGGDIEEHLERVASAEQALVFELKGLNAAESKLPLPTPPKT